MVERARELAGDEFLVGIPDLHEGVDVLAPWIRVGGEQFGVWLQKAERLISRYGTAGLYLHFPPMQETQAHNLMEIADRDWREL